MATSRRTGTSENVSTYDSAGGKDYTALNTWEAATDNDLVATTTSEVLECYVGAHDDSLAATGAVANSSYFRILRPATGQFHAGIRGTGVRFVNTSDVYTLRADAENNISFQDVVVTPSVNSASGLYCSYMATCTDSTVIGVIAANGQNAGAGTMDGIYINSSGGVVVDCLCENNERYGFYVQTNTQFFANCTSYGHEINFYANSGDITCKNCLGDAQTLIADFYHQTNPGNALTGGNNNASSDGTAPGTSSRTSQTFTYVASASNNYHLASGDAGAKGYGADLSADATFAFDDDIDRQTMSDWPIGMDEPQALTSYAVAYVEVNGTDRSTDGQRQDVSIEQAIGKSGVARVMLQSPDASWRPSLLQTYELWMPGRYVSDGQIYTGETTIRSNGAVFTAADVGRHVRLADAGIGGSFDLYAEITSVTDASTAVISIPSGATVYNKLLVVGKGRLRGHVVRHVEKRLGGSVPSSREFAADINDLTVALDTISPSITRPKETLYDRLLAIIADRLDDRGLFLHWPQAADNLLLESGDNLLLESGDQLLLESINEGGVVAAVTYDGNTTAREVLDDLMEEEGVERLWLVDALGGLRVTGDLTTPQALTNTDMYVGASVSYDLKDYANQVRMYYTEGLTSLVVVDSAAEQSAVGVVAVSVNRPDITTAASATTAANALLTARATRTRYTFTCTTDVDGFQPGQSGTITLAEHGVSGSHLIHRVVSKYASARWTFDLTATNGTVPTQDYLDWWEEES